MTLVFKVVVVLFSLTLAIAIDLLLRIFDWALTPSGRGRNVGRMDEVNNELLVTFGERELADDSDEETTTPWTDAEDYIDVTYVHDDEFV